MNHKINSPLIIYGYGKLGVLFEEAMETIGILPEGIIDSINREGSWVPKSNAVNIYDYIVAICVSTEPFGNLKKYLISMGFKPDNIVSAYDIFNAYPEIGIGNGWSAANDITKEDFEEIELVRKKLNSIYASINYRVFLDWRIRREETDILKIQISTSTYCLPSTLKDIKERRQVLMEWHHHRNFVSIHNEGRELEAVEKGLDDFIKFRPIISVACYHSRDGLWEIEKTLMEGLSDYSFSFQVKSYQGQGAYMYCIPKEMT